MQPFNKYITGEEGSVAQSELERLTARYEWFTTARRAKALLSGKPDPRLVMPLTFWATVPPSKEKPAKKQLLVSSVEEQLIDRFIERGGYRIIPDEGAGNDLAEVPEGFEDDGMVTEELAEIYRTQGLYAEAKEIYRKLSLLNPEKSIYFADVIAQINSEINNN